VAPQATVALSLLTKLNEPISGGTRWYTAAQHRPPNVSYMPEIGFGLLSFYSVGIRSTSGAHGVHLPDGVVVTQEQTGRSAKEINSDMVELASTSRLTFDGNILTCRLHKCVRVATNVLGHPTFHFLIRHYVRIYH
jgi:hypothetical protein